MEIYSKKSSWIFAVLISLSLCSCSNTNSTSVTESQQEQTNVTQSTSNTSSEIIDNNNNEVVEEVDLSNSIYFQDGYVLQDYETRYNKVKSQYPDSTILIWANDENIRYEEELNDYLNQKGYPFVIVFRNLTPNDDELYDDDGRFRSSYSEQLKKAISNGEQIDIVSTGYKFAFYDTFSNPYHFFTDEEILLPIENLLQNSNTGKTFYEEMPDNYWQSLIYNGHIYGIDGYLSGLHNAACLQVNTNLVSEDELSKLNAETFPELLTQLYDISSAYTSDGKPKYSIVPHYFEDLSMFADYDFIWESIYIDANGKACNIYEAPEIENLFETIYDGYNSGYIVNRSNSIKTTLADFAYTRCGDKVQNGITVDSFFGTSAMDGSTEGYRIYPQSTKNIHPAQNATGICSKSPNADLAVEALALCLCDESCNNLLCFGTDYEVKSNCIYPNGYYNTIIVENRLVHNPFYGLFYSDIRAEYKTAYETGILSPYINFTFDGNEVADRLIEVQSIVYSIPNEFPNEEYKSGKEYLDSLNQRLYDAGLQDILDEANKQLEKYNEENN